MKRQRLKKIILVGAISTLVALGSICAFAINKSPIARLLIRDVVVATVANYESGEKSLFNLKCDDVMSNDPVCVQDTCGNSVWMLDYSQIIVPFFEQTIRETPVYPKRIIAKSVDKQDPVGISGVAYYENKLIRIFLNEQVDTRYLLTVLVHEHIHLQGGQFIDDTPPWVNIITCEVKTQAATIETLADMCHSGDTLACATFWNEIRDYSSSAFWVRLQQNGLEEWYLPIATLFWPEGIDFQTAPIEMVQTYLQYPWDRVITPGVLVGRLLDTGNLYEYEISNGNFVCKRLLMPFDDTEQLLGWLDQFIEWMTPEGD